MSFTSCLNKNIFYQHFKGHGNIGILYIQGHKVIPYESFKALKIKNFCQSKNIPFIWFDYMGYGKSEGVKNVWQLQEWLENINAVACAVGLQKYIIISESMGGYLALAFHELAPKKVAGVFSFAPGFGNTFQNLSSVKFISSIDGNVKIDIKNDDGFNYINHPFNIKVPVQFLYSYDDTHVNIKSASYIREAIKNALIMKIKGVDHSMNNDECVLLSTNFISACFELNNLNQETQRNV